MITFLQDVVFLKLGGRFASGRSKPLPGQIVKIKFDPESETIVEEEPQAVYSIDKPCSSRQVDAGLQQPVAKYAPWTTTDDRPAKLLKLNSNLFVPSSTSLTEVKTQEPQPVLS